jgi:hypothetical protein
MKGLLGLRTMDRDDHLGPLQRSFAFQRPQSDYDRATSDFDQAIRLDPKYTSAYYGRGVAKLKSGDIAGGEADTARATVPRVRLAAGRRAE